MPPTQIPPACEVGSAAAKRNKRGLRQGTTGVKGISIQSDPDQVKGNTKRHVPNAEVHRRRRVEFATPVSTWGPGLLCPTALQPYSSVHVAQGFFMTNASAMAPLRALSFPSFRLRGRGGWGAGNLAPSPFTLPPATRANWTSMGTCLPSLVHPFLFPLHHQRRLSHGFESKWARPRCTPALSSRSMAALKSWTTSTRLSSQTLPNPTSALQRCSTPSFSRWSQCCQGL